MQVVANTWQRGILFACITLHSSCSGCAPFAPSLLVCIRGVGVLLSFRVFRGFLSRRCDSLLQLDPLRSSCSNPSARRAGACVHFTFAILSVRSAKPSSLCKRIRYLGPMGVAPCLSIFGYSDARGVRAKRDQQGAQKTSTRPAGL
jgi:hypothetical protein